MTNELTGLELELFTKSVFKWRGIIEYLENISQPLDGIFRGECGFCDRFGSWNQETTVDVFLCDECPLFQKNLCSNNRRTNPILYWEIVDYVRHNQKDKALEGAKKMLQEIIASKNLFKPNGGVVAAIPPLAKASEGVSLPHEL